MKQENTSITNHFISVDPTWVQGTGTSAQANNEDDLPVGFANLSNDSRELVQSAFNVHRQFLQDGELMPPSFIIENNKAVVLLLVDGRSQQTQNACAETARQVASSSKSEFVMFVSMVWVLPTPQLHNTSDILAKYGSIKKYPGSLLMAFVSLETRAGRYCAVVPVLPCPPSKTSKKLGPVIWQKTENDIGTFSGILPLDGTC